MSKIQWTDLTKNPIKEKGGGNYCVPISPGCKNCYASRLNSLGTRFGGNGRKFGVRPGGHPEVTLNVEMLKKWARMRKPKKIFVCSMTDLFGEWVPDEMIFEIFDAMADAPKQNFQILTKRPDHMNYIVHQWILSRGGYQLPANIWPGVSAEDQQRLDERLIWLLRTETQTRFLSLEPLLGPIELNSSATCSIMEADTSGYLLDAADLIDWVIIGGESGPDARPMNLTWVTDILDQCREAGIPAFVKQLGSVWAKQNGAKHRKGGDPGEWPPEFRVRMMPLHTWYDATCKPI